MCKWRQTCTRHTNHSHFGKAGSRSIVQEYPRTNKVSDSKEQSPSWGPDATSATQEIPHILLNSLHNDPPLSRNKLIQPPNANPISFRFFLVLSLHLNLYNLSCLFTSEIRTKTLYWFPPSSYVPHSQPISSFILKPERCFVRNSKYEAPHNEVFFSLLLALVS